MKINFCIAFNITMSVFLAGCSSTYIKIQTDLYAVDPTPPTGFSRVEVQSSREQLKVLSAEAKFRTESLGGLAELQLEIYKIGWQGIMGGQAKDLSRLQDYLLDYQYLLSEKLRMFESELSKVDELLIVYNNKFTELSESKIVLENIPACKETGSKADNKRDRRQYYRDKQRRKDTITEKLNIRFLEVQAALNGLRSKYFKFIKDDGKDDPIKERLAVFLEDVEKYRSYVKKSSEFKESIEKTEENIAQLLNRRSEWISKLNRKYKTALSSSMETSGSGRLSSSNRYVAARERLRLSEDEEDSIIKIVTSGSHYYNLIDRLQDMGDPAWRIVSDPKNECLWNSQFSKTYFRAEGNNSVTIVRDSPTVYRPQYASNDPAALIKGQLQVSRAIASAALSVAGAVSGVPVSSLSSTEDDGATTGVSQAKTDSENFAKRKARVEEMAKQRTATLNSLAIDLRNLLIGLNSEKSTKSDNYKTLISRLKSTLSAHKEILAMEVSP